MRTGGAAANSKVISFGAEHSAPIPSFVALPADLPPTASHPLVEEVAEAAKDALTALLRSALAGAGRHFTAKSERAVTEAERRHLLDTLHALRPLASALQRALPVELERTFAARPDAAEPEAPGPAAGQRHALLWRQLAGQLEDMTARQVPAAATQIFAPARLHAALQRAVQKLELPDDQATAVIELLDEGVIAHLDQVYRRMLERLELRALGSRAAGTAANSDAPAIAPALAVHASTREALEELAYGHESLDGYGNAHLAAEMAKVAELAHSRSGREGMAVRDRALIQRLSLAGQLFDDIAHNDFLSGTFKAGLERLRFPVLKAALADASFFANRSHPLRALMGELVLAGASSFLSGDKDQRRMEGLLGEAAQHFGLSAQFVRPSLAGLTPLPAATIERFLADVDDDRRARQNWIVTRAQHIAALLVDTRCMGQELPEALSPFLRESWAPVMARRLASAGRDSEAWRDAEACLDELIERLRDGSTAGLPQRLLARIRVGLRETALNDEAVQAALHALEEMAEVAPTSSAPVAAAPTPHSESVDLAETPAAVEETPAAPGILDILLRPGRWFRVYDHERQQARWLKLESYHARQDAIAFTEFDGCNPLGMSAGQFLADLQRGRSVPSNPDAEARRLIAQLREETPHSQAA